MNSPTVRWLIPQRFFPGHELPKRAHVLKRRMSVKLKGGLRPLLLPSKVALETHTPPAELVRIPALPATVNLWRINAKKADAFAVNPEGVTIDDARGCD